MSDRDCDCARVPGDEQASAESTTDPDTESTANPTTKPTADRWLRDPTPGTPLPADVSDEFERFLDTNPIKTIGDLRDAFERTLPTDRETLCYVDEPTPHRGTLDGEQYYFECFYDAILLAELADAPVDVRTETPAGTVVEARANGDGTVTATPETAVLSLGIRTDRTIGDEPSLEAGYRAICPAVNAFRDRGAYETWVSTTPVATIGVPLSAGATLAARLVG